MECNSTRLSYGTSGYFSRIIVDYVEGAEKLREFYGHPSTVAGLAEAIKGRERFDTNRKLLVSELKDQYAGTETSELVMDNIEALASPNTFTICTAHQPVIFTGTLYFIYKILHAVKLAEDCAKNFPGKRFVPVFYMGSEDADLEELGKIYMANEKITWDTTQKGAVGRMKTKDLDKIITRLEGEIVVEPFGKELIALFRDTYLKSDDIQTATFRLLNTLFKDYGVVILVPDRAGLKKTMLKVFEDDIFHQKPSAIVAETTKKLSGVYKVQANPRDINLFYLKDDIRELITFNGKDFEVKHTELKFSEQELRDELKTHPERFSPNVILRGLFQETILPNIAFIGGGGETAYWLELQELFKKYNTPYPVLVLRNSFLIIEKKWQERLSKLGISDTDIFGNSATLLNKFVKQHSDKQLSLSGEIETLKGFYADLKEVSGNIDPSLQRHVDALQAKAIKYIQQLEKKLLKVEKRKFDDQQRQINQVKNALFPLNGLQERIDNFIPWYAKYGKSFFETIYQHSPTLEQEFVVLTVN